MKCPTCNGTKTQTITVQDYTEKEVTSDKMEITCVFCDGTGVVSQDRIDQRNWEKAQWCKCKLRWPTTYVPDNVSPICDKHHWTCDTCGLITQVG